MKIRQPHSWKVTPRKAVEIQRHLRPQLVLKKLPKKVKYVAGMDVSSSIRSHWIWAGVVILDFLSLEIKEEKWVKRKAVFPYVPGLLSFREIPPLLSAIEKIEREPDLIFCDGQGIAHPRGLGLASHLGLLIEKPTIGCAKTRLVGEYEDVGRKRGEYSPLFYKNAEVGAVLRTKTDVKPLFVSPGNRITVQEAIRMVLECGGRYRIPEPVRRAHLLVNRLRKKME